MTGNEIRRKVLTLQLDGREAGQSWNGSMMLNYLENHHVRSELLENGSGGGQDCETLMMMILFITTNNM